MIMHRLVWVVLGLVIAQGARSSAEMVHDLSLEDSVNAFGYLSYWDYGYYAQTYFGQPGISTGYGMGGYGDSANAQGLQVCNPWLVDQSKCTTKNPDAGQEEWRFVKDMGWVKLSKYSAARKDWWDYKRTLGWPFHTTYGIMY